MSVMPLTDSTIRNLQGELLALQDQKQEIDAQIEHIAAILASPQTDVGASQTGKETEKMADPASESRAKSNDSSTGLRDGIRSVLVEHKSLKPGDVTKKLVALGITSSGKTPFNIRVYNELWRMYKRGHLKKSRSGRYSIYVTHNDN